jgi:hypothetical protein
MEHDPVNHPKHYTTLGAVCDKCKEPIECIQVVRHMQYNLGNAIKYIWRCDLKGKSVEDLRKAVWYLQDEIKERVSIKGTIEKVMIKPPLVFSDEHKRLTAFEQAVEDRSGYTAREFRGKPQIITSDSRGINLGKFELEGRN